MLSCQEGTEQQGKNENDGYEESMKVKYERCKDEEIAGLKSNLKRWIKRKKDRVTGR